MSWICAPGKKTGEARAMTLHPEFIYDFGSPNAYLVHKVLPRISAETGTAFTYTPCLLGGIFKATNNRPPMLTFENVKGKMAYERKEMRRFIEKHGLSAFQFNRHFPVNTLLLMRGAAAAQLDGLHEAYIDVAMRAMWEESEKMDDPQVFVTVMTAGGLDGAGLLARSQDADVKALLTSNTASAVERGVFGIPSFFVGDEMFFGKERLSQVAEEIKTQLNAH
jgi:2-hydroxychromene-2-carboxylate isomerase